MDRPLNAEFMSGGTAAGLEKIRARLLDLTNRNRLLQCTRLHVWTRISRIVYPRAIARVGRPRHVVPFHRSTRSRLAHNGKRRLQSQHSVEVLHRSYHRTHHSANHGAFSRWMRPHVLAVAAEVGDGRTGAQLLLDADRSCVLPAVIGSESALGGVGWAGPCVRLPPRRLSLLIPSAVRSCPYNHATLGPHTRHPSRRLRSHCPDR